MTRLSLTNRYALAIAGLLAIAIPVGAQPGKTKAAEPPANRDPYFTPTAANSTSTMPRVIIRTIREDRAGNIWFATFGGPIRYDGKSFTNFSEEVGLAKTRVFSLLEARSGALWFGSITGGASRFDGKSVTKFTAKDGLANNDVVWIFEDRDANIWFATGAGVSRYDGKAMTTFTTKDGLVHNSVYTIAQDAAGRIWFGTQGGICSYDGKSFADLADQVGRPFVNIRSTVVDRSGNLWFGGQEGAFRYDGKTVATFTSKDGLLDDFVGSMIADRAGNLWFGHPGRFPDGSGGGASRYDGKTFKHFTQKDGLGSATVYCMLEDKAGNIWFGSADAGACRYDGKAFTNYSAAEPAPAVSLLLTKGTAERWEKDVHFRCEVTLDNALGRDLAVRSNFGSVFDGLELVVTTAEGKVVAQQGYTSHQSPFAPPGRRFPLKQGKTGGTLVFPISGLPADARLFKVRLVGTLPGSGHDRILSSETLTVEVKDRPRK